MARNTQFFDQSKATVILDNKQVVGFMSGDAIRVVPNTEGSSLDAGLDNTTTVFSSDQSGTVELDLKGVSPSLDVLNRLWQAQTSGAGRLFTGFVVTSALEPIQLEGCSIGSIGGISTGGKQAAARTIVINVQRIKFQ